MIPTPPKDTNQDLALLRNAFADLIEIRSMLDELLDSVDGVPDLRVCFAIDRIQTLVWTIGERLGEF